MEKTKDFTSPIPEGLSKTRRVLKEVLHGFTAYELEVELRKEKGNLNNLLMLMVLGNFVGVPSFPPYYSLRILPCAIPHIDTRKRSVLREKGLTDKVSIDI
jgi:hypothetical protein